MMIKPFKWDHTCPPAWTTEPDKILNDYGWCRTLNRHAKHPDGRERDFLIFHCNKKVVISLFSLIPIICHYLSP